VDRVVLKSNKTEGAIVPHLKTKNGGLRRFVELGKEFVKMNVPFTLYSGSIQEHEWDLPFPVKDWSDIKDTYVITGDPLSRPDLSTVKGKLFIWVIAGGEYFKHYDKLTQYPMLVNNPEFLKRYPKAIVVTGGVSDFWQPKKLRVGFHGSKGKTVLEQLGDLPNVVLVPMKGLTDEALRATYHSLDWFASAEPRLGWCNMAAEALACGVPVVTMDDNSAAFSERVLRVKSLRSFFSDPLKDLRYSSVCQNLLDVFEAST
jgi:hypothetical protein